MVKDDCDCRSDGLDDLGLEIRDPGIIRFILMKISNLVNAVAVLFVALILMSKKNRE